MLFGSVVDSVSIEDETSGIAFHVQFSGVSAEDLAKRLNIKKQPYKGADAPKGLFYHKLVKQGGALQVREYKKGAALECSYFDF